MMRGIHRSSSVGLAGCGLGALLFVVGAGPGLAQTPAVPMRVGASVTPGTAQLGARVRYVGRVVFAHGTARPKWLMPPEASSDLSWGAPVTRLAPSRGGTLGQDTLTIEMPLQAFKPGLVLIPGLRFQDADPAHPGVHRLPMANLTIVAVLSAADSNADLKPPRGPLAAPWYERVPWRIVLGALLALLVIGLIVWRLLTRKQVVAVVTPSVVDPAARALEALAVLRALHLPAQGKFDEHAFQLSRILRRYLEAVTSAPRPGHTTPELVAALRSSPLGLDDIARLKARLDDWDRIKFARAQAGLEDAVSSEDAVEALVRRFPNPSAGKAA